jgi:tRNA threonylcarbamoyl adenosine modification protein YeaZ
VTIQLAIDTSTDTASLALADEADILAELTWRCGQNHTRTLLPNLACLLERVGSTVQSLDAITVAKGPGSFNGLRVGLSTAKGLAFSLGIPIVGVSTLEAAAYQFAGSGLPVCAIQSAGRSEFAAAIYQMKDATWQQVQAEQITTLEGLSVIIFDRTILCGEITPVLHKELKSRLGEKAVIATPAARLRRAGFLAELGRRRLVAKEWDDPACLSPLYLRRPRITKPKRSF